MAPACSASAASAIARAVPFAQIMLTRQSGSKQDDARTLSPSEADDLAEIQVKRHNNSGGFGGASEDFAIR
jgi:hypothetical protein